MKIKPVEFFVEGSALNGMVYHEKGSNAAVLILDGGSNVTHNQSYYPIWQHFLVNNKISSFTFDFRGVGDSGLKLEGTSLNSRLTDALKAVEILKSETSVDKIYITGVSMGAPIAIRLANLVNANGLILISPSAYSEEVWGKNFGTAFTDIIKTEGSWKKSKSFEELKKFAGDIILTYGQNDEVVPMPVLEKYASIIKAKQGIVMALENVGHRFWRDEDKVSEAARVVVNEQILSLLNP